MDYVVAVQPGGGDGGGIKEEERCVVIVSVSSAFILYCINSVGDVHNAYTCKLTCICSDQAG